MRFSAFMGSLLALALGGASHHTTMALMEPSNLRLRAFGNDPLFDLGDRSSRPSRIQKGTGAGGADAHRRWKARRAAGIY